MRWRLIILSPKKDKKRNIPNGNRQKMSRSDQYKKITLTEQTVRIRRNLLLVSLLIIFKHMSGIELKELNILGNVFTVNNPKNIDIFLYATFTYFLFRFFQYVRNVEGHKPWQIINHFLKAYVRTKVATDFKNRKIDISPHGVMVREDSFFRWHAVNQNELATKSTPKFEVVRFSIVLRGYFVAAMKYTLETTHFLDVVFPMLIALAVPYFALQFPLH